jgi:hypothetical protein
VLSPVLIALTLGLVAAATVPTRRLYLMGWGTGRLVTYLAAVVAIGFAVTLGIGPLRLTVPALVVLAAAPFLLGALRARTGAARRLPRPGGAGHRPKLVGSGPGRTVTPGERSSDTDESGRNA